MKSVYTKLLNQYGLSSQAIKECWTEIEAAYTKANRYYHNMNHLSDLYKQLQQVESEIGNWNVCMFTLFYHDIIYVSTKSNNEEKSAELAAKTMQRIRVPQHEISNCEQQIMATKSHLVSGDSDTNYFTDSDLSILGRDWETYSAYGKNVRREYAIYPELIYRRGRKKVLKHFLTMERIFKTDFFFDKYEKQAKANLRKELNQI